MNLKNEMLHNSTSNLPIGVDPKIISDLELKIHKLTKICDELNPYQEIPLEMQTTLKSFGIMDFSNPFHLTNTLVVLLEDAIEELHRIKPHDLNENF